jgi:hypothetical protein
VKFKLGQKVIIDNYKVTKTNYPGGIDELYILGRAYKITKTNVRNNPVWYKLALPEGVFPYIFHEDMLKGIITVETTEADL